MKLLQHLVFFCAMLVSVFWVLLTTADDNLWYIEPVDAGDDDGFFLATVSVMTIVGPAMLVLYLGALWICGPRRS